MFAYINSKISNMPSREMFVMDPNFVHHSETSGIDRKPACMYIFQNGFGLACSCSILFPIILLSFNKELNQVSFADFKT